VTISLLLPQIANAISHLSIAGVTIKDVDAISTNWTATANVLYPNPEPPGWVTGFQVKNLTFVRGASAHCDISYTLNYRFLGVQIGDLSQFTKSYSDLVEKVSSIVEAVITNDAPYSGAVDMTIGNISFGKRLDMAGNAYHGADIPLIITEMQNT
jgi:hypothetical protein